MAHALEPPQDAATPGGALRMALVALHLLRGQLGAEEEPEVAVAMLRVLEVRLWAALQPGRRAAAGRRVPPLGAGRAAAAPPRRLRVQRKAAARRAASCPRRKPTSTRGRWRRCPTAAR